MLKKIFNGVTVLCINYRFSIMCCLYKNEQNRCITYCLINRNVGMLCAFFPF